MTAAAVGYFDGLDLPLAVPDFTDYIRTLIATEHTPTRTRLQPRPKTAQPQIAIARCHCAWAWG